MVENFIQNKFGYCFYSVEPKLAIIFNLYVHPEFRRQGHSKKLLKYVIQEIRELNYKENIFVEVCPKEDSVPTIVLENYYKKFDLKILLT